MKTAIAGGALRCVPDWHEHPQLLLDLLKSLLSRHGNRDLMRRTRVSCIHFERSVSLLVGGFLFVSQQFSAEQQQGQNIERVRLAWHRHKPLEKFLVCLAGNLLRRVVGDVRCR